MPVAPDRSFDSIEDLKQRVPEIGKDEFRALAAVGALNFISGKKGFHRRDALWQVERSSRWSGPLLARESLTENQAGESSPLDCMNPEKRLNADFRGTGVTIGLHPMAYQRNALQRQGVSPAVQSPSFADGKFVRVAGAVIARQRPGTAKEFVSLSLEDETGVAKIIITPQLFD